MPFLEVVSKIIYIIIKIYIKNNVIYLRDLARKLQHWLGPTIYLQALQRDEDDSPSTGSLMWHHCNPNFENILDSYSNIESYNLLENWEEILPVFWFGLKIFITYNAYKKLKFEINIILIILQSLTS